jgi:integrase
MPTQPAERPTPLIVRNPCGIKGAGVEATPERPVITLAQVLALAAAMPPRYRALVLLAVFASMRWGELIGLRRVDLDLESASVSIERSAVEVGKRIVIKTPKTSAGIRSVALPVWLVPELLHHLDTFAEAGPDGRVFLGPYGATPFRRNFATIWKRAKGAAGVPADLHFHDLRHAGNHFAAASGASTRELMGRRGSREHARGVDLPAPGGRAGPGYRGSAGRDAAGGGVSAILGTFWARGPQAGAVRLGGPRNKLDLTRADAMERVTRIQLA